MSAVIKPFFMRSPLAMERILFLSSSAVIAAKSWAFHLASYVIHGTAPCFPPGFLGLLIKRYICFVIRISRWVVKSAHYTSSPLSIVDA
ncbi:hypothetical protein CEXT_66881 [Caerostris extrusa]|uniref:Uncharacterized protein n=1 Tax=Caerostris extrusa TaxID=172846 RepID=A0AAV4T116_CAEEX|nr:hypothetical protein CEXT_66881 [Caerostris extrusa]